jgi:hypothetical protein
MRWIACLLLAEAVQVVALQLREVQQVAAEAVK